MIVLLAMELQNEKKEKVWEKDKNVNIHGNFEIMLGRSDWSCVSDS